MKRLILILIASLCLAQGKHAPSTTGPISTSLAASNWQEIANGPVPLTNCCGGALSFNFPVEDGTYPSMNYLFSALGASHGKKHQAGVDLSTYHYFSTSLQIVTTGSPTFNYVLNDPSNTCGTPASVRPYFQQANDNYANEFGRWWANPISYTLQAGQVTMTVPIDPGQWSSVYGKLGNTDAASLVGFQAALRSVGNIGMTFGGGCFFGHGVNISGGTAQFLVLNYSIQ